MNQYQKTYRGFAQNQLLPKKRFKLIKIIGFFVLDLLFSALLTIKKILTWILLKIIPLLGLILYKITSKTILIPIYRLILGIKRRQKISLSPQANKLFFLFSNRYVSHSVAILIILITIIQNINIRNLRAEDFGRYALFSQISKGQHFTENLIEEEIILPDNLSESNQAAGSLLKISKELSPAVNQTITLGQNIPDVGGAALTQGGSAIIKPDLSETFDTPKPRDRIITYIVKEGDTIFDIAEEFRISVNTILWANKLSSRSIIRPGMELTILPASGVEHTIKSGETIGSIAAKYNIPQEDILEINLLSADAKISINQKLTIPDGRPLYAPPPQQRKIAGIQPTYDSADSGNPFFWPTTCRRITQYFQGWRHTGIDIACSSSSNVYAAADGVIEKAGWNAGGYGNRIIIKHPDGSKTLYAHLKEGGILVNINQYVAKGEVIGLMGSTGRSTGYHLHFEVIVNGSRINPFNRL
ncbi:MAG: LysM peptidoglycan-binding domain-containing M23 family metallopeptidase [Patescibacteria group bacterium]